MRKIMLLLCSALLAGALSWPSLLAMTYTCQNDTIYYHVCCVTQDVTNWNITFFYGIGGILMLVGAGLIVDNVIRSNDRKQDSFYNP